MKGRLAAHASPPASVPIRATCEPAQTHHPLMSSAGVWLPGIPHDAGTDPARRLGSYRTGGPVSDGAQQHIQHNAVVTDGCEPFSRLATLLPRDRPARRPMATSSPRCACLLRRHPDADRYLPHEERQGPPALGLARRQSPQPSRDLGQLRHVLGAPGADCDVQTPVGAVAETSDSPRTSSMTVRWMGGARSADSVSAAC
jgi:hypothetical protein